MQRDLKPGSRVARKDITEISGEVISMRNDFALVRWSIHFQQWVFMKRLILVCRQARPYPTKERKTICLKKQKRRLLTHTTAKTAKLETITGHFVTIQ